MNKDTIATMITGYKKECGEDLAALLTLDELGVLVPADNLYARVLAG